MKILLFSDLHLSSERLTDQKILLGYILGVAESKRVSAVFFTGDFLHERRHVNVSCLTAFQRFIRRLNKRGISFVALSGNHDRPFDQSKESATELLRIHDDMNVIAHDTEVAMFGRKIALVPFSTPEVMNEHFVDVCKNKDVRYIVTHGGFNVGFREFMNSKLSMKPMERAKNIRTVFAGDFHKPCSKGKLTYIGSPMDLTFGDSGQPKRVLILDTSTGEVEKIRTVYPRFIHETFEAIPSHLIKAIRLLRMSKDCFVRIDFRGSQSQLSGVPIQKLKNLSLARETEINLDPNKVLTPDEGIEFTEDILEAFRGYSKQEKLTKQERKFGKAVLLKEEGNGRN